MWLLRYMAKNSLSARGAVKGDVQGQDGTAVLSSGEHKNLRLCQPYGVASIPPEGACAVVLPLDDGEVSLGVLGQEQSLSEGELMLYSKGGASIVLKNDGRVLINGREYGND